jgi:hypothetical protein
MHNGKRDWKERHEEARKRKKGVQKKRNRVVEINKKGVRKESATRQKIKF